MQRNRPTNEQQNKCRLPDAINVSITNNFTQIPNDLLRRPDMSGKAKAILCLLLSNQEGWVSYMSSLQQMMKEGPDALHSGLQELEQMGYLLRVRYRDKITKKWIGSFWAYSNSPNNFNLEKPLKQLDKQGFEPAFKNTNNPENPGMENPDMANRHMENPGLIIPINKKTNLKENHLNPSSYDLEDSKDLPFNSFNNGQNISSKENPPSNPPKKLNGKITPKQFDEFWTLYPKRDSGQGSKGTAKTKWNKLCRSKNRDVPTWRQIKGAIIRQKKSEQWQNTKYIPMPTTWLNNSRWLDDPSELRTFVSDEQKKKLGPKENPNFYADGNYAKPKPGKYANVPVINYDSEKGVIDEN